MNTAQQLKADSPVLHQQEILHLPFGLLGFEQIKEYFWLESPEEAPFRWLQACHQPDLTFLVVSPFEVLSEYHPAISDEDVAFLGLSGPGDALLFGIVTLRHKGRATVNLKGPIVLNRHTQRGKQIVLVNATEYPVQYPLPVAG